MRTIHKGALGAAGVAAIVAACAPFTAPFEGYFAKKYRDPVGVLTICYGQTAADGPIDWNKTYSKAECQQMLARSLPKYVNGVAACIDADQLKKLSEQELVAYSDFAYNAGVGNFCKSSMLRLINAGDRRGACDALLRWTTAKGQVFRGLVRRRQAERALCLEGAR